MSEVMMDVATTESFGKHEAGRGAFMESSHQPRLSSIVSGVHLAIQGPRAPYKHRWTYML